MKLSIFAVLVGVLLCISLDCTEGKSQDDLEFLDDEADVGSGGFKSVPGKRRNSAARIDDEDDSEGSGSGGGPVIKPQPPARIPERSPPRGFDRPSPVLTTTTTTTTTTEAPEEEEERPEEEGDNEDNEEDPENEDDLGNEEEEEEDEYEDEDRDEEPEVVAQPETPSPTVRPAVPDIVEASQEEEDDDNEVEPDEPVDIVGEEVFPGPGTNRKTSEEDNKSEDVDSDQGLVPVDPGRELPPVDAPPAEEVPEGNEPGKDVHVYGTKEDSATSFFAQPGILAAIVGGAVVGLLFAILVVMFIVYRMRKKDEGSYILDEKRSPTSNSYSKSSREFYA